ncbi:MULTISPECIES: HU family DNA-binding protein [Afifella]|uniref:HU family DNA-binding protein n=1 Tax=Afifella TaxID=643217 RepID=UPI000FE37657|nr:MULTISPECIES: HU family DNA-binding protein [Afifella]MCT8266044.1 HU family DNA-binding protein [Afifella sp. JA880]
MNKGELAAAVAEKTDLSKTQATDAVEAVFGCITDALKKGEEVRVLGFGNFAISERAASTGRNPQTGEKIEIKASKQAKFKPGKGLKDAVNS